jgi:hypothetical protein
VLPEERRLTASGEAGVDERSVEEGEQAVSDRHDGEGDQHTHEQPELQPPAHEQHEAEREHAVLEQLRGGDDGVGAVRGGRQEEPGAESCGCERDGARGSGQAAAAEQPLQAERREHRESRVREHESDLGSGDLEGETRLVDRPDEAQNGRRRKHDQRHVDRRPPVRFTPGVCHAAPYTTRVVVGLGPLPVARSSFRCASLSSPESGLLTSGARRHTRPSWRGF